MTSQHEHFGDCDGTWCDFCGCCQHGAPRDAFGCRVEDAPEGMACPNSGCGCNGDGFYTSPIEPPAAPVEAEARPQQLHQETSLFEMAVVVPGHTQ